MSVIGKATLSIWLGGCVMLLTSALPAASVIAASPIAKRVARMQAVARDHWAAKRFMGVILVAEGDKVLLLRGYGYADLARKAPDRPSTQFPIASLTKQFTAAAILMLCDQERLQLDATLGTYLPDIPPAWRDVTVRQLLNQDSGIPNFTGGEGWMAYKRGVHSPLESIARIREQPLRFPPGTKFEYSNTNYVLLGLIIERVTKQSFADFIRATLLLPAGLEATDCATGSSPRPILARGYVSTPGGFGVADNVALSNGFAAGCLFSTASDLLRWNLALFGGMILSERSLATMTEPGAGDYAMGLFSKQLAGHRVLTHNGSIDGYDASLNFYPDSKLTIAVLGNVGTNAPDKLAEQLALVYFDQPVVINADRRIVPIRTSVLAQYVGNYRAPGFGLTIALDHGALMAINPAGRRYVLNAQSDTMFFLKEIDVQISMRRGADGRVVGFTMTQDGVARQVTRDAP